jgi:hypothetical protein
MLLLDLNSRAAAPLWAAALVMIGLLMVPPERANAATPDTPSPPSRADIIAKLQTNPARIFLDASGNTLTVAALISAVRDLTVADKNALKPIVEALKLASTEEKSAIGTGLGQAAQALLKTDPPFAAEIQQALAASGDSAAILAFAAVTGNVPIGATGGGAGGAGGAGSSAGGGGASGGGGGGGGTGSGGGGSSTQAVSFTSTTPSITTTTTTTATTNTTVTNALTSVSP